MTKPKSLGKKLRIGKKTRENSNVPAWVIMKSGGKVRTHPKRRQWRSSSIKV
ncbi:MAG: 50S ribosomal protein L39e [Candidatus Ranarchaeia archaeon]